MRHSKAFSFKSLEERIFDALKDPNTGKVPIPKLVGVSFLMFIPFFILNYILTIFSSVHLMWILAAAVDRFE